MFRIIIWLCILASFNIVAIQLFMLGNSSPFLKVLPHNAAIMTSAAFTIIADIVLVYVLMVTRIGKKTGTSDQFDRLFQKHYNGNNRDEAFEKASKEWKARNF